MQSPEAGRWVTARARPNRHATAHRRLTKHPVIASAEPGERWLCCYPDDAIIGY